MLMSFHAAIPRCSFPFIRKYRALYTLSKEGLSDERVEGRACPGGLLLLIYIDLQDMHGNELGLETIQGRTQTMIYSRHFGAS